MTPRQTARLILIDARDRCLLLKVHGRMAYHPHDVDFWLPPGGGLEAGESADDALIREVWEEIGLRLPQIGPWVWRETFVIHFDTATRFFETHYNFIRVTSHAVDTTRMGASEQNSLLDYRWWSLAEMQKTTEWLIPLGLPDYLADLLAGRVPAEPLTLKTPT